MLCSVAAGCYSKQAVVVAERIRGHMPRVSLALSTVIYSLTIYGQSSDCGPNTNLHCWLTSYFLPGASSSNSCS